MKTDFALKRYLTFLLIALALIGLRLGVITFSGHEKSYLAARSPRQKTQNIEGVRGSIFDTFGVPMASQKKVYKLYCIYSQIQSLPLSRAERKKYVKRFVEFLGQRLEKSPDRLEEEILGCGALTPHTPYLIADHLSEKDYFFLKAKSRYFPGLHLTIESERFYPLGKCASHLIGTLGRPSKERLTLEKERLQEKGFSSERLFGTLGLEAFYDTHLQGVLGTKSFEIAPKGNLLREVPSNRPSLPGSNLHLSLCAELQWFAEKLLEEAEGARLRNFISRDKRAEKLPPPWILGGSIVAMDPKTGAIRAMASYPLFDPNAFISKNKEAAKLCYLESQESIFALWDGIIPFDEKKWVTFKDLLDRTLLPANSLHRSLPLMSLQELKLSKDPLVLALTLAVTELESWDKESFLKMTLPELHLLIQGTLKSKKELEKKLFPLFVESFCIPWEKEHFAESLKERRLEEKLTKKKPRPAFEYLTQMRKSRFKNFWKLSQEDLWLEFFGAKNPSLDFSSLKMEKSPGILALEAFAKKASREELSHLFRHAKSTKERAETPIPHPRIKKVSTLIESLYESGGYGFLRSKAIHDAWAPGSLFKAIPAIAALESSESFAKKPFDLVDLSPKKVAKGAPLGYLGKEPILRLYKGGRLPKSAKPIGVVNLIEALESSSNLYFSLLAASTIKSPDFLLEMAANLGLGDKCGIDLPGERKGRLPIEALSSQSDLYAFAIGQGKFTATPLQMAQMLAVLATGKMPPAPSICSAISCPNQRLPLALIQEGPYPFRNELMPLGIDFPLFITQNSDQKKSRLKLESHPKSDFSIEPAHRDMVLEGFYQSIHGSRGCARANLVRNLFPLQRRDELLNLFKTRLVGKTSTAELAYRSWLEDSPPRIINHVSFGAICFDPIDKNSDGKHIFVSPDLVVVVSLRFGSFGYDVAPFAARIVDRWQKIKEKHKMLAKEPTS